MGSSLGSVWMLPIVELEADYLKTRTKTAVCRTHLLSVLLGFNVLSNYLSAPGGVAHVPNRKSHLEQGICNMQGALCQHERPQKVLSGLGFLSTCKGVS